MIFIRFPGKEANASFAKPRPWDFRPEVVLPSGRDFDVNLNFEQIWQTLYDRFYDAPREDNVLARAFSCTLYRNAYMLDRQRVSEPFEVQTETLDLQSGLITKNLERFGAFSGYAPKPPILRLAKKLGSFGGFEISYEAFLYVHDLMSWNEAVKYYYDAQQAKQVEERGWAESNPGKIRRPSKAQIRLIGKNTGLTHLRVMGYLAHDVNFGQMLGILSKRRGVAPVDDPDEARLICRPFLSGASDLPEDPRSLHPPADLKTRDGLP